ncbi:MAG: thermostable hemolysin delta-VPH [Clostridia bacterium]|nr:thermostable hemolysin delta-VPH [Clostridia bacterium]
MSYFNYHATAKKLIRDGKLKAFLFTERYNNITPALVLLFDDIKHPVMPIRKHHWAEYIPLIEEKN